jgi:CRP-like cAMP-binding protein
LRESDLRRTDSLLDRFAAVNLETHLLKLRKRDEINAEEEAAIRNSISEVRSLPADVVAIREGQELSVSTLLLDGWMGRTKMLATGERQIAELHVAGDFADLHSFTLKRLDHDVVTLSECTIGVVPHHKLHEISERLPHLMRVYWFMTNLDASITREWTLSLGKRQAIARMANLFCELFVRLDIVGLTDGLSYEFPLTQVEMSECLGLTGVHVNRTLQELRRMGLIEVGSKRVTIRDWPGLQAVAEFDPSYLYLEWRHR